jgi:hypothetical protein
MNFAAFERAQVAAFAYRVARRSGSIDCLRAVCFIVRNRVKSGWCAGAQCPWLAVMNKADEVAASAVEDAQLDENDRLLQLMVSKVDDIYSTNESFDDQVSRVCESRKTGSDWKPVLYYSFVDRPPRPWFAENIIRKPEEHPQVGNMGKMMLYR